MQILSLGMATRMVAGASFALLKSQGRFTTIVIIRWSFVAIQIAALTTILALGGGVADVAVAVAVIASLIGPVTFYSAIRPYGAGLAVLAETLVRPGVCGIVSVGAAWLAAQAMEHCAGSGVDAPRVGRLMASRSAAFAAARRSRRCVGRRGDRQFRRKPLSRRQPILATIAAVRQGRQHANLNCAASVKHRRFAADSHCAPQRDRRCDSRHPGAVRPA
jgi:hypothetical protein